MEVLRQAEQVVAYEWVWDALALDAWGAWVAQRWVVAGTRSRRPEVPVTQPAQACWAAVREQWVVERVARQA
jgi:hypothetical protein